MGKTDTEQDLDYEHFSDLQAFSYPMEWNLAWDWAGNPGPGAPPTASSRLTSP